MTTAFQRLYKLLFASGVPSEQPTSDLVRDRLRRAERLVVQEGTGGERHHEAKVYHMGGYVSSGDHKPNMGLPTRPGERFVTEHNPDLYAPYGRPAALRRQVGGDHYSKLRMQPFEFTLPNGWDGAAHTILKYVHRHADKGGRQDLEKAIHVVDIRAAALPADEDIAWLRCIPLPWATPPISIRHYVEVNEIAAEEANALYALNDWVEYPKDLARKASVVKACIQIVIDKRYRPPAPTR